MSEAITYLERLKKNLQALHGAKIIVGVQGEPGKNFHGQTVTSNTELQKIAYVHEFGWDIKVTPKMRAYLHYQGVHLKKETTHIHIPERSYIRRAARENKANFLRMYDELGQKVVRDKISGDEMLDLLGKEAMTRTFADMGSDVKALSALTIKRRKNPNTTPLIDSGKLLKSY